MGPGSGFGVVVIISTIPFETSATNLFLRAQKVVGRFNTGIKLSITTNRKCTKNISAAFIYAHIVYQPVHTPVVQTHRRGGEAGVVGAEDCELLFLFLVLKSAHSVVMSVRDSREVREMSGTSGKSGKYRGQQGSQGNVGDIR